MPTLNDRDYTFLVYPYTYKEYEEAMSIRIQYMENNVKEGLDGK